MRVIIPIHAAVEAPFHIVQHFHTVCFTGEIASISEITLEEGSEAGNGDSARKEANCSGDLGRIGRSKEIWSVDLETLKIRMGKLATRH